MPRQSTPITRVCALCGDTYTRPNWKQWRESRYCSPDCYAEARRSLPKAQRAALMTKATAQIRGHKRSHEDLCRRAQGKQRTAMLSGDEAMIMDAFHAVGLHPIPLYAVDKFNIDFAFPDAMLAVEYHGGNWHNTPAKRAQDARKAAFLREHGWTLLVFPRIDKPQDNDAGNERVTVEEIVERVRHYLLLS